MYKFFFVAFCTVFVFISFSQKFTDKNRRSLIAAYTTAEKNYEAAGKLSDDAGNDDAKIAAFEKVYQKTLVEFIQLLPLLQQNGLDSLYFLSSVKTGLMYDYFDSIQPAKKGYAAAIHLENKIPGLPDSLLFQPFLFTGSICYRTGDFDSSFYYLKKAEAIQLKYNTTLLEEQRLYNLLGVLYYETGNLNQSKNYVEKAIEFTVIQKMNDLSLLSNYKLNLASILIKLERFAEAETVLNTISSSDIYRSEVNHKLGFVCLKMGRYKEAIRYFDKVKYLNSKKIIDLALNKSKAFGEINEPDSSSYYLLSAKTENQKWNGRKKNISNGIILKQEAEELAKNNQYRNALFLYHQSILQFSNNFTDTSVSANPETFSGIFAYIDLFNILSEKGDVLKKLYNEEKDTKTLEGALNAYRSAFKLADYVSRTYDSDEARLFLGKIKHNVHSKPIEISLQLFTITQKKEYLEEAYLFDQRNKASVLSYNVQANELKNQPGKLTDLAKKEALLKSAITRLSLKTASITDSAEQQKTYALIRDNEIELGKLQDKINDDPQWQQKRAAEQIPSVAMLQKKLDPSTTLLSYHLSENDLLILLISANQFEFYRGPVNKGFFTAIESLKTALQTTAANSRYAGADAATFLYRQLIFPVQARLQQKKRLILIPDDELNYLPFEALQDENKKYLVEKFAIQYQFSTALVMTQGSSSFIPANTLAFAPFASAGHNDSTGSSHFSILPASGEETSKLKGKVLTDTKAVKNSFLQMANQYSIVHLATHASVNNKEPMRSYIAFYPGSNDYKLYAQEIYDLNLDSLQLIILSACETGTGKLIKGEGLMSLSRAFTYAGCPNIITSLWKAEDKSTAFITGRLHYYLEKKYTKDQALQQAKLDFLHNPDIDPRLKAPNYWAHLIFIGNYEPGHHTKKWWWIAIIIITSAIAYKLIRKNPASKAGPQLTS
jgi:CHAT domain-containing protein